MATWHRIGDRAELMKQVPCAFRLDRWSVAVFFYDGAFRTIGNSCNHKGGPLSEGRLHGEFVMCPWHAWEYSVITGKGPEGFDEEQVPVFAVEEREDGVYVQTPPVMPRRLLKHKPSHLLEPHEKAPGAPPRVLLISTTAMDDVNPASRRPTRSSITRWSRPSAARRTLSTSSSATSSSATARGTTPRPPTPAPGHAPSPSGIPRTSLRRCTRDSCTGRTWC